MRHHHPRQPSKKNGFSWSRSMGNGIVVWRLFRRDQRGAIHCMQRCFVIGDRDRRWMAIEINAARHALRDQVDTVDLELMGITS